MATESLDLEFKGIGSQLKNRLLAVPVYQRPFAWEAEQVQNYWRDIQTAAAAKHAEYFMGTVVLTKSQDQNRDTVIDGQQRLATSAMLLAAIRDEYRARGDDRRANIVQGTYLSSADLKSGQEIARLRLSSDDDSFFLDFVLLGKTNKGPSRRSHHRIVNCHALLREYTKEFAVSAGKEWAERLYSLVEFLASGVRVIVLSVPSEADAFLIFETLNDRGADLTIADLLKNYLFGQAGDQLDLVRDGWIQSVAALEIPSENSLFTVFLRHYWSSKRGTVRERDLYKDIRDHVATAPQAVEFVDELQKAARLYSALLNSDHEEWGPLGADAKSSIETFLRLDLEQVRPLMLAAMQHFEASELKVLLRALTSWGVRGLVSGRVGGGTYERAYCDVAVKIRKGEAKNTHGVFDALAQIIPTDDEFAAAFSVMRVPRNSLARYYLLALESASSGEKEPELVPNDNAEKVNLEHVLPQNATDEDWGEAFPADERKAWVYRLGNLALLQKGPNSKIGNKPFAAKKPIFAASQLKLTSAIGAKEEWNPAAIEARQKNLAGIALKAWPRKP